MQVLLDAYIWTFPFLGIVFYHNIYIVPNARIFAIHKTKKVRMIFIIRTIIELFSHLRNLYSYVPTSVIQVI